MLRSLASLALAAALHAAVPPAEWVPVSWRGGPLEMERRARDKTGTADPEVRQAIEDWYDPSTLDLIRDTPINCLLVTWSNGEPSAADERQRVLVTNYAREARKRGLVVLAVTGASAGRAALDAGFDGVVVEGGAVSPGDATVLLGSRAELGRHADWQILGSNEGQQPGVRFLADGAAQATPSSEPWIDSNTWLVRSLRAWSRGRPIWLSYTLNHPSPADYVRAIADTAAAGARWIPAPDDNLRVGLIRKRAPALAAWRRIAGTLRFYEEHRDWRAWIPAGPLAVVQDPAQPDSDMFDEAIKLIGRRQVPYRVIERADLSQSGLDRFPAALVTGIAHPEEREKRLLLAIVERGGLLLAGPDWPVREGITVYKENPPDPETVSRDARELLGPRIPVKAFNVPSVLSYVAESPAGDGMLVHLVSYASHASESGVLRIKGEFTEAVLYAPDQEPRRLTGEASDDSVEFALPRLDVVATVVLRRPGGSSSKASARLGREPQFPKAYR